MIVKKIQRFLSLVLASAMVLSAVSPLVPLALADNNGTVNIRTNLTDGAYTLKMSDGTVIGHGSGVNYLPFNGLETSALGVGYMIVFDPVTDYKTPDTVNFLLRDGDILNFGFDQTGAYQAGIYETALGEYGNAVVNLYTNLTDGSYTLYYSNDATNANPLDSGRGVVSIPFNRAVSFGLGTGFKVVYGAVPGYRTPADLYFMLKPNDDTTYGWDMTGEFKAGSYEALSSTEGTGTFTAHTNLTDGAYTLYLSNDATNSNPIDHGSGILAAQFTENASSGLGTGYKLVFADVAGYTTPAPYFFMLIADQPTVHFGPDETTAANRTGIYSPIPSSETERLFVRTSHASGAYRIYRGTDSLPSWSGSGQAYTTFTLDSTVAPGLDYTIQFDPIAGLITPANRVIHLVTGHPQRVTGVYALNNTTGNLVVDVIDQNGDLVDTGDWTLRSCTDDTAASCSASIVNSGGPGTINPSMAPGYYRVDANPVVGFRTPVILSETQHNLLAGETYNFFILYDSTPTTFADPTVTSKTASVATPAPGEAVTYTVSYGNLGTLSATHATLVDDYDEALMTVSGLPANCTDDGTQITCDLGTLAGLATGSLAYTGTVKAGVANGTVANNTATIDADSNADAANDAASRAVTVTVPVTGRVTVAVTGAPVSGGDYDILRNALLTTYINQTGNFDRSDMVAGTYSLIARPVTVAGTTYNPTTLYGNTIIATQGDIADFRIVYTPATALGTLTVTLENGSGAAFGNPGDYDILRDGAVTYANQTADYSNSNEPNGTYLVIARPVTVGGVTYAPAVTQVSLSDTIAANGDAVTFRIDYTASAVTGRVQVDLVDGTGAAFTLPGDYDIDFNTVPTFVGLTANFDQSPLPAGTYTVTPRPVTVGGTTYNATVARISASSAIVAQNDLVRYQITYAVPPTTGRVTVTLENGAAAAFTLGGDYDILRNGVVAQGAQTANYDQAGQPVGVYTLAVRPVTVAGTTYVPLTTRISASDTISATNNLVSYRIDYIASTITGRVLVTLENGAGAAFGNPGDYDIALNGALAYLSQTANFDQSPMPAGTYSVTPRPVTVGGTTYNATVSRVSASDTIAAQNDLVHFRIDYVPNVTGSLTVTLENGAGAAFTLGGDYDIVRNGAVALANQTANYSNANAQSGNYLISARPVTVAGTTYLPTVTLPADTLLDTQNETIAFRIDYIAATTTATVSVTTTGALGAVFLNGNYLGTYNGNPLTPVTGTVNTAVANTISFGAVAGFNTPANIVIAADQLAPNSINPYVGPYTTVATPDPALSSFGLNPASAKLVPGDQVTYQINYANLGAAPATGVTVTIDYDEAHGTVTVPAGCTNDSPSAGQMTCSVADLAVGATGIGTLSFGYTVTGTVAPGTVITHTATIAGSNGNALTTNDSLTTTPGTTVGAVTVTKTVSLSPTAPGTNTLANIADNTLLYYTVTVARNTTTGGTIDVTVNDTLGATGTILGGNGGSLTYQFNTGDCTGVTCDSNKNFNTGAIVVHLGTATSVATITYQARASFGGIPTNSSSVVTNTASATATGLTIASSAASVTINGQTSGGTVTGTPSEPTSGRGGGYKPVKGEMKLEITKSVSTDGTHFTTPTAGKNLSIAIPENKSTRVYNRVTLKNLGAVSATNIKLRHFFETGKSDITAEDPTDLIGATESKGYYVIDKIKVGETVEFTYSVLATDRGQNVNPATDGLELTSYGSNLPVMQDGLTYLGLGSKTNTYLYAGKVPANADTGTTETGDQPGFDTDFVADPLSVSVSSDKPVANVGDTVTFTIKVRNITDEDLHQLYVTHELNPGAFEIADPASAKALNASMLQWKKGLLAPNETLTLSFKLKVKDSAPVGQTVRGTTQFLVSEFENVSPFENSIRIGAAGQNMQLAQTGPGHVIGFLMLLSILSYFGYGLLRNSWNRRQRELALQAI